MLHTSEGERQAKRSSMSTSGALRMSRPKAIVLDMAVFSTPKGGRGRGQGTAGVSGRRQGEESPLWGDRLGGTGRGSLVSPPPSSKTWENNLQVSQILHKKSVQTFLHHKTLKNSISQVLKYIVKFSYIGHSIFGPSVSADLCAFQYCGVETC